MRTFAAKQYRPFYCSLAHKRFLLLAAVIMFTRCASQQSWHMGSFDQETLIECYARNNQERVPVAEYMINAYPMVLIYPDGLVILREKDSTNSPSGLLTAQLLPQELTNVFTKLTSHTGFWGLSNHYRLTKWTDQMGCHVTLRIPGRPEKTVGVYGNFNRPHDGDAKPPDEFVDFLAALSSVRLENLRPWDPGYVEVEFSDYSYAPGPSLDWPRNWPPLRNPLTRYVKLYDEKIMIFPSGLVPQLDAFLAARGDRSAIKIDGWKAAVSYRWPMPGEKTWTTFK